MAESKIKSRYVTEKLIYGSFPVTEITQNQIWVKINELMDFNPNVPLSLTYLSSENQNTTSGLHVTYHNALETGFTFGAPYVGGTRALTISLTKTNHGLGAGAQLNIPLQCAIKAVAS